MHCGISANITARHSEQLHKQPCSIERNPWCLHEMPQGGCIHKEGKTNVMIINYIT